MPDVFYHFTSKAGADGITRDKVIKQSTRARAAYDARHGDGVYLTTLDPAEYSKTFIKRNNYDGARRMPRNKLERAIKITFSGGQKRPIKVDLPDERDVYLYEGDLALSGKTWEVIVVSN